MRQHRSKKTKLNRSPLVVLPLPPRLNTLESAPGCVGGNVGLGEGGNDGSALGRLVGCPDGALVGEVVGCPVGLLVGVLLGEEGLDVG